MASDDLATIWLDLPSDEKEEFSRIVNEIEKALAHNPLAAGESRTENRRLVVEPPVAIAFEVIEDDCLVNVLEIKLLRTG